MNEKSIKIIVDMDLTNEWKFGSKIGLKEDFSEEKILKEFDMLLHVIRKHAYERLRKEMPEFPTKEEAELLLKNYYSTKKEIKMSTKPGNGDNRIVCKQCPACGGDLHRDVRENEIEYKGEKSGYDQPGWYCDTKGCEEVIYSPEDTKHWNLAASLLKARVEGED